MMQKHHNLELTGTLSCVPLNTTKPFTKYVFQRTRAGHGNVITDTARKQQVRIWVKGTPSFSSAQTGARGRLALAVGAWQALDANSKKTWQDQASNTGLNAFQLFIKNYCNTHAPAAHTIWDKGNTTWDSNTTFFD